MQKDYSYFDRVLIYIQGRTKELFDFFRETINSYEGYALYADASTGIGALAVVADTWTDIPNDGLGTFLQGEGAGLGSREDDQPLGQHRFLDPDTGYFDFSSLSIGDTVFLRNNYTINPSINNTSVSFRYAFGAGGTKFLDKRQPKLDEGSGIEYRFNLDTDLIIMATEEIKNNPWKLQIKTSSDSDLVNEGTVLYITLRS